MDDEDRKVNPDVDDEALEEAVRQMEGLYEIEQRRRDVADSKLGNLQNTIELILTLVTASFVVAVFQEKVVPPTMWQILVYLALGAALGFFVWAAQQITKANDPKQFSMRTAGGVLKKLNKSRNKRALLTDAAEDYAHLIDKNHDTTSGRLTLYRAAIENILKGVYCLATIPALFAISLFCTNAHAGNSAPGANSKNAGAAADPMRFQANSMAFHRCIAPLGSDVHMYPMSWDETSERRALHILTLQTDCLNMSGVGGLTISKVECASGYHFMPKEAYEAGLRAHRWKSVPPFPTVGAPCM